MYQDLDQLNSRDENIYMCFLQLGHILTRRFAERSQNLLCEAVAVPVQFSLSFQKIVKICIHPIIRVIHCLFPEQFLLRGELYIHRMYYTGYNRLIVLGMNYTAREYMFAKSMAWAVRENGF